MNNRSLSQPTLWPHEKTLQLILMQAEGKSFGEMGAVLGMSRNAVAGKCTRLGLAAVTVSAEVKAARHFAGVAKQTRMAKPEPLPFVESLNIAFIDRGRFECSYLTGSHLVCGNKIERGSYCAAHARIVYQPVKRAA